jgi:2-keto-4-pentenoate hydratase/2-oxohepta-3-ene-1,7-dioic acid hydratase in catechol pathway
VTATSERYVRFERDGVAAYVTLLPGDVLFTGTPGRTQAVSKGDTIEVEIEGVGVLRNTVAR